MNKTIQFSAKTQYVTPWCKCAEIRAAKCILAGSGDLDNGTGLRSWHGEEDVNNENSDWGY